MDPSDLSTRLLRALCVLCGWVVFTLGSPAATSQGARAGDGPLPLWWADVPVPEPTAETWEAALAELRAATAEPPPLVSWLVAGPFQAAEAEGGGAAMPQIDRLADGGTVRFLGRALPLRAVGAGGGGRVSLNAFLRPESHAFAAAEITAARAGPARLFLSGAASATVWLNGRLATDASGAPLYLHPYADSDALDVDLREGANTLLFRLLPVSTQGWWFAARVGRYPRLHVEVKVLVTLADAFLARFPDAATRALVTAAERLTADPEPEWGFAEALLNRVRAGSDAPVEVRQRARRLAADYYRRVGAVREEVRALAEAVSEQEGLSRGAAQEIPWGGASLCTDDPALAQLLFGLADALFRAGRRGEAVATYERLVGQFQSGRYAVEALLAIAERYREMGLRDRAKPVCEAVLRMLAQEGEEPGDRRRATAEAILDWTTAQWADRPYLERDFEAERLIQRADNQPPEGVFRTALALYIQAMGRGGAAVLRQPEGLIVGIRPYCADRIRGLLERPGAAANWRMYEAEVGDEARDLLRQGEEASGFACALPSGGLSASALYRAAVSRYPFSVEAADALNRLGNDALAGGRTSEAALCFGRLLTLGIAPEDAALPRRAHDDEQAKSVSVPVVVAKAAFCAARASAADARWVRLMDAGRGEVTVSVGDQSFALRGGTGAGNGKVPDRWLDLAMAPSPRGRLWPTFGGGAARTGWMEGQRTPGLHVITVPFADSSGAQVGQCQAWPNPGSGAGGRRLVHFAAVAAGRELGNVAHTPPGVRGTGFQPVDDGQDGRATAGVPQGRAGAPRSGPGEAELEPGRAFFHTDRMLYAVDLADGRVAWRFGRWWGLASAGPAQNRWGPSEAFFTTVAEGRVYVRMRVPQRSEGDALRWAVYAVSAADGRLLWSTEARRLSAGGVDEESPAEEVVSDPGYAHGHVYVLVRVGSDFPAHALAALRADTGEVVWRTTLCSGPGQMRVFSGWPGGEYAVAEVCPPPTVAGKSVIAVTNLGHVFSVDALTGDAQWAFEYERGFLADGRGQEMRALVTRDIAPAIVRADTVIACPRDTGAIFGLDAATGRLRWRLDLEGVERMIGSDDECVYLDGEALLCVEVATGAVRWRGSAGGVPSVGAGVLVGRRLLVPTADGLVERSTYRDRVAASHTWPAGAGPAGNLVLVGDRLVGFGREGLTIFSHEAAPQLARRAGARAALMAAEAAADEGRWADAEQLAAQVAPLASGAEEAHPGRGMPQEVDWTVRAHLVRARSAWATGDRHRAEDLVRNLLVRDSGRLIRWPERWVGLPAAVAQYLPDLAVQGPSPPREEGAAPTPEGRGAGEGQPPPLDLEAVVAARVPFVAWPSGGPADRFAVVAGRWVECRRLDGAERVLWRTQLGVEPTGLLWCDGRLLVWSAWEVAALSQAGGLAEWRYGLQGTAAPGSVEPIAHVMAEGPTAVVASARQLAALETSSGRPRWTMALSGRGHWPVAAANGRVHLVRIVGTLMTLAAHDSLTGLRQWEVPLGPRDPRLVCANDGQFLWCASGAARTLVKVDLRSGRQVASTGLPAAWGTVTFHDIRREGPADDERPKPFLVALANTGSPARGREVFWQAAFDADSLRPLAWVKGGPFPSEVFGSALVLEDEGALSAWDLRTTGVAGSSSAAGERRWTAPLAKGDRVLALAGDGSDLEVLVEAGDASAGRAFRRRRYRVEGDRALPIVDQRLGGVPGDGNGLDPALARAGARWTSLGPVGGPSMAATTQRPGWLVYPAADGIYVYRLAAGGGVDRLERALEAALAAPASPDVPADGLLAAMVDRSRPRHACVPAAGPITADGSLDDWPAAPVVSLDARRDTRRLRTAAGDDDVAAWEGPDDLSASIRAAYDAKRLYLAVEVTDDVHSPAGEGADLWRGDAVEVAVQSDEALQPAPGPTTLHLAAVWRDGGPAWRCLRGPIEVAQVETGIRRGRCSIVYEWAIPWESIGAKAGRTAPAAMARGEGPIAAQVPSGVIDAPPRAGAVHALPARVGFGLLVSDADGGDVKGGIEFGAGISAGLVPGRLGRLELMPGPP